MQPSNNENGKFFIKATKGEVQEVFFLGKEIEIQENKHIPQPEQLAFIKAIHDNGAIAMFENDLNLQEKIKASKFDWSKSSD